MLAQMRPDPRVARVAGDACRLPLATNSVDLAFSAYGAIQFVADLATLMREVARVVRPGGRWVFSLTHPIRWAFLDEPGPEGLVVAASYFDRTPYVERDGDGTMTYAEHHRTLSDLVRTVVSAGFAVIDLVEPEWPIEHTQTWGGWSPLRGFVIPGTVIFVCELPR